MIDFRGAYVMDEWSSIKDFDSAANIWRFSDIVAHYSTSTNTGFGLPVIFIYRVTNKAHPNELKFELMNALFGYEYTLRTINIQMKLFNLHIVWWAIFRFEK